MPKRADELTALDVRRITHPGGHERNHLVAAGGAPGLYLQVTPGNARSWILRVVVHGKRRAIGLGAFPTVGLAEARELARAARLKVAEGIDPVEERKAARAAQAAAAARALTFSDAVGRYMTDKGAAFRSEKHRRQWRATLNGYAGPIIGAMPMDAIEVRDVLRVLRQPVPADHGRPAGPLWEARNETAARLRGRIERVIAWAGAAGLRALDAPNPAAWRGLLAELLPAPSRVQVVRHHAALSLADAPAWFEALRGREGIAARALEFVALTACRSGEARKMTWAEIDLAAALWTVPAARMKARRAHRVPLSPEAVALLEALPRFEGCPLIFPGARGKSLCDMSLSAVCRRMHADALAAGGKGWTDPQTGRPMVPHGARSLFRDWVAERTAYAGELAEIALAHRISSAVEAAYRRGDQMEKRRAMMADWAAFLSGREAARVVAFPSAARG